MTLIDLLTVMCFITPILDSFETAKHAHARFGGYTLAIATGLILGVACTWLMRLGISRMVAKIERLSKPAQSFAVVAALIAMLLWIFLSGFLGIWMTDKLLRLIA